ncbi:NodT family RND efflux system outer membrane lipoprotein [Cupriavidus basilensis OR16]|uniref:NodT family RND efflux system outer membrane lipoprotein n=1 Tax=Cupriavidus basilensis OR16 TaxID=1127483 RepID=H1S261_9BURK|nr:efflux transporter outer membrane subunit [Cupriavidus basilensis]EHP43427.1 NodT family RND efflux system outer membrane lipoprotein [Cupriavidus basilensis OR16]
MSKLSLLLPAVVPLLFACTTVGPDYHVPEQAAVRSPQASGPLLGTDDPAVSVAQVPDDWWRLYDDPKLDALVQQALSANTSLRVAAANLRRAVAIYHEVEAENLPQAAFSAKTERAQIAGESFLLKEKVPVFNLGDVGFSVSYLVDFFGKLARADEAALASAEASQAALDMARVSVVAQTVRAYVQGCAATHELAAAQQQVALAARGVEIAGKMVAAGRGQPADMLRARAQAETLRAALPRFKAEKEGAAYRLAVMLGQPPAALPQAASECHEEPTLRQAVPVGDGAALLKRRPDIRQAERELASATAKIGVATADLYPSIRIGASAGLSGILSDLGTGPTAHWGLGPLITWNLPTNGVRPRIHAMEAGADAALARFDGVVLKALQETQGALSAYTRELERNRSLRVARDDANEVARQQRLLYQAGRVPYLSSLDADRTLAGTEAALAASDSQVAIYQIDLFLALGGGWQNSPKIAEHRVNAEH